MSKKSKPHTHDLERQWATPSSAGYPRWRRMTGSGDNLNIFTNIVVVRNQKEVYSRSRTHAAYIDNGRQHILVLKAHYFRFAPIMTSLMQWSHAIGTYIIVFIMHANCEIGLYMVMLNAVDGEILLLLVRVRHIKNAKTWLLPIIYSSAANNIQSYYMYICRRYMRVSQHSCLTR